jgi:hypothetical protein
MARGVGARDGHIELVQSPAKSGSRRDGWGLSGYA